jgi:hypothetical protein
MWAIIIRRFCDSSAARIEHLPAVSDSRAGEGEQWAGDTVKSVAKVRWHGG